MRGRSVENTIEFAGLTRHDNVSMTDRAAAIAGMDADEPPEHSFAQAVRELKTADDSSVAWRLPDNVARRFDESKLREFNAETGDGTEAYYAATPHGEKTVFVETDRFQSLYSPEVLKDFLKGDYHETNSEGERTRTKDGLWHVPTKDYSITNPVEFYEPLEQAIRDEDIGDSMFGRIREYKRGGEIHMDIMFDAFTVEFGSDAEGEDPSGGPVVLGLRTGYDFFGGTKLYAEGFAQDTSCANSIRNVTDQKSRRSVGNATEDVREWWEDILGKLGLMTDQLAEMIDISNGISIDILEMGFAEPMDHDDDLIAFYEHAGFPTYLANAAASNVESRAEDPFEPTLWDLHSGATYALTHEYQGTENTSRMNQLSRIATDMIQNPHQVADTVERTHRQALREDAKEGYEQGTLQNESVNAEVARFTQSLEEQKEEFETRQDELRELLEADLEGETA